MTPDREHADAKFAPYCSIDAAMSMDVDDIDPLKVSGEGLMALDINKLTDVDFFNFFSDDFDDVDIN
ncbi:small acidic protein 1-like [Spinacia oleracea]|uniref:Small acidic protein 1-like n=1 Tax=Spinacia oleracea TaxID=3562 RepID=A0A9R0J303_SPIOL|nr:small acidic protein 1-like [Spinacia oleracea]